MSYHHKSRKSRSRSHILRSLTSTSVGVGATSGPEIRLCTPTRACRSRTVLFRRVIPKKLSFPGTGRDNPLAFRRAEGSSEIAKRTEGIAAKFPYKYPSPYRR